MRRWLFAPAPYFDLAVLRLVAVGTSLYKVLSLPDALAYLLEVGLPYRPMSLMRQIGFLFNDVAPTANLIYGVYGITVVAGVLAFVGLRTNLSLLLFALGNIFLQAYLYSFGDYHHPEAIMMIALLALAFSPCGHELSLDARWRRKPLNPLLDSLSAQSTDRRSSEFAGWPIRLIQVFFCLMYLSAVISKHHVSGWGWANGFTLQAYLIQDGLRWGSPLALWAAQFHTLIWLAQLVVLGFQGTFWVTLIFPRTRWLYLPLGLVFHTIIYVTLQAPFWQWMVLYVVFIPLSQVRDIFTGRRRLVDLFNLRPGATA